MLYIISLKSSHGYQEIKMWVDLYPGCRIWPAQKLLQGVATAKLTNLNIEEIPANSANPSYRREIGHTGQSSVDSYGKEGMFLAQCQEWWILCVLWWSCSSTGQLCVWTLYSFYSLLKGHFYTSFLWLVCNFLLVAKLLFQKGHLYPQRSPHNSTLVHMHKWNSGQTIWLVHEDTSWTAYKGCWLLARILQSFSLFLCTLLSPLSLLYFLWLLSC